MRGPASLAYLLARTSDTVADSADAPTNLRLECLELFRVAILCDSPFGGWPLPILLGTIDPRERRLLEKTSELLEALRRIGDHERAIIRDVLETIISGQTLDLICFAEATLENPIAFTDEAALEDYTWRVAGCVGAFWTKLGFATMGDRFSNRPEAELLESGILYGKGLQLVNILRDLPADLASGRCYLPAADPRDIPSLLECHSQWVERASRWVGAGEFYADQLISRRLGVASLLPALIAGRTLAALRGADWGLLKSRVKVPRRQVYRLLAYAVFRRSGDRVSCRD